MIIFFARVNFSYMCVEKNLVTIFREKIWSDSSPGSISRTCVWRKISSPFLEKKYDQILHQGQFLVHVCGEKTRRLKAPSRFYPHGSNSGLRPRSSAEGLILENILFSKAGLRPRGYIYRFDCKGIAPALRSSARSARLLPPLGASLWMLGLLNWLSMGPFSAQESFKIR